MLDKYFVQTCRKITPARNAYGDYLYDGTYETINCRFRHIMAVQRGTHQELVDTDAMLWVSPSTEISYGDIIYYDGQYFQVERVNKARRLGSEVVEFLKCDLKITEVGVS